MLLLNFTDILTGIYILCLILYSFQVFINSVANESIVASINLDWRDDLLSRQYSLYRGNVILRKYLSMMHGQRVRVVYIRSTCCVDIILYTSLSLYVSHPFFYGYMYLYACTCIRMLAYTTPKSPVHECVVFALYVSSLRSLEIIKKDSWERSVYYQAGEAG